MLGCSQCKSGNESTYLMTASPPPSVRQFFIRIHHAGSFGFGGKSGMARSVPDLRILCCSDGIPTHAVQCSRAIAPRNPEDPRYQKVSVSIYETIFLIQVQRVYSTNRHAENSVGNAQNSVDTLKIAWIR